MTPSCSCGHDASDHYGLAQALAQHKVTGRYPCFACGCADFVEAISLPHDWARAGEL